MALRELKIGASGVRGVVGDALTPELIVNFACAFGTWCGGSAVVIGRDIETTGNTSAASIPLATHRLLEEHPELSGGLALQIGFGAGLVFGAQVVVLP